MQAVQQELESGTLQLPVYSETAARLQAVVADDRADVRDVERVLAQDPALAAQVLRVANSPFYGGLSKISTIQGAAQRLGLRQIVNIATLTVQRAAHNATDPMLQNLMKRLWEHSVGCATGAKWLAEQANCKELANEAFMAGLLHDVGSLLLLKIIDGMQTRKEASFGGTEALIIEILTAFHGAQGARVIRHWSLPEEYAGIAEGHQSAQDDPGNMLLQLVSLANEASKKIGYALVPDPTIRLNSSREAEVLGVKEITLAELEIVIEDGVRSLA